MLNVKRWVEPLIHFIIWLAGFIVVAVHVNNIGFLKRGHEGFLFTVILATLLNVGLFYTVALGLIPRYSPHKCRKRLFLYLLLALAGYTLLESVVDFYFMPTYYSSEKEPYFSQFMVALTSNLFILSIALGYGFTRVWLMGEKHQQELKSEKLSAELNYLKAQVNPHFLFNMLNLAFASATKSGDEFTADLIEKIASQLRYMLYDSNIEKVPVSMEIEHINGFISLQKLRMSSEMPVNIIYQTQGDFDSNFIAPLLLIPFIENAFKYGKSFDDPSQIEIRVECINNTLELKVVNPIKMRINHVDKNSSGIGLENVRKRLALIYPGMHNLEINEKQGMFNVYLQIQLN
ncbi:hypothetical protein EO244_11960 [Ancylomarina salipaludis]|uniref:Signal transduction histidine kinase internal region domain-containing protein n=1 Tax=Ancylomarina salipaludis TaxID=2501299 RepID=A0A4V1MZZ9_9BACT|nr:histidine kinase [Ancylomarina salipaludis]RXQ92257.1 hypothetical protein EO244_11960 [Ancylomarina salipaludis]